MMKNGTQCFILLLVLFIVSGCASIDIDHGTYNGSEILGVVFVQDSKVIDVKKLDHESIVNLKSRKFSILVKNNEDYKAIQVCASESMEIYNQVKKSRMLNEIPCFAVGTGMAAGREEKGSGFYLQLSNGTAHNYFHSTRTINGKKYRLINIKAFINRKDASKKPIIGNVYSVIFIDKNSNKKLEKNEFELFLFPGRS